MPARGTCPCIGSSGTPACSRPRAAISLVEVDAGGKAHALQHEDQILGDDIARRAGRERAAAEAGERGVEAADALLQPGRDIGEAEAHCVVHVQSRACGRRSPLRTARTSLVDLRGVA